MNRTGRLGAALALVSTVFLSSGAHAQSDFYKGKSIEIVASFAPGGAVDLQARLLAPFFEKHIEGNPRVTVSNKPGGGGLLAANWFDINGDEDGTYLFVSGAGPVLGQVLQLPEAEYNLLDWKLVAMSGGGGVIFARPELEVANMKDLVELDEIGVFGGMAVTQTDLIALIMFDLFGIQDKVRVVMGFEGKGALLQSFQRNETQLDFQTTAAAYLSNVQPLVDEGEAIPLVSVGMLDADGNVVRDPSVPDLPTVYEAYQEVFGHPPAEDDVKWQAYKAWLGAGFSYRGGLWAPKNIKPEALEALLEAVDRINADPEFHKDAAVLVEHFPMFRGDVLLGSLQQTIDLSPEVQAYIADLIAKY